MNEATPDLLTLLRNNEFTTLETHLTALQKDFEANRVSEQDLQAAFEKFQRPDSELGDKITEWIKQFETSYPAHVSLANWFLACAWEARGQSTSNLVSDRGWRGLHYFLQQAEGCARHATTLTDNPFSAWLVVAYTANTQGCQLSLEEVQEQQYPDWFTQAIQDNPHSLAMRRAMLYHLRTEWGGSEEHMMTFVRQQQDSGKLSANDMNRLWAGFHSCVSHHALHFADDMKTGVERAELAANLRELEASQLLVALTTADRPEAYRRAALERYLKAAELEPTAKPDGGFYWALYNNADWLEPFVPRIVALLQRANTQGDDNAAIALGRLRMLNRKWTMPDPLPALKKARYRGNAEAAETIVDLQEVGQGLKGAMLETAGKREDMLKAADLGSHAMSWRVYRDFNTFQNQFDLEPRTKYRYLLRAADAGNNDARFELAQQLRAGFVEVGEDGVLRPVDTRPLQDSLNYAKHLLERAAGEDHKKATATLKKAEERDWQEKTARRVTLGNVANERKAERAAPRTFQWYWLLLLLLMLGKCTNSANKDSRAPNSILPPPPVVVGAAVT